MGTNKPVVIGIAGGSGSGKTSVTKAIFDHFKGHSILILEQDYYYKDQSHLPMEERLKTNYDHPLAFDNDLLIEHLRSCLHMSKLISLYMTIHCIRVQKKLFQLSRKM